MLDPVIGQLAVQPRRLDDELDILERLSGRKLVNLVHRDVVSILFSLRLSPTALIGEQALAIGFHQHDILVFRLDDRPALMPRTFANRLGIHLVAILLDINRNPAFLHVLPGHFHMFGPNSGQHFQFLL